MSEFESSLRFIPRPCIYGGVALWIVTTAWLCSYMEVDHSLDGLIEPTDRFYFAVTAFHFLTGLAMAIQVVGVFSLWVTMTIILTINLLTRRRRLHFKTELRLWGSIYAFVTFAIFAVLVD